MAKRANSKEKKVKEIIKHDIILAYALENAIIHDGKAQINAVISKLFQVGLKKEQIKDVIKDVQSIVNKVNTMTREEQAKEFDKLSELLPEKKKEERKKGELPELLNAEKGKVILRHAPFPSGALHIGNAIPLVINDEYVKKYEGKAFLIIDDTIGSEEKQIVPEAYMLIPDDLKLMDIKYDGDIIYRSDRLNIYYKYAEMLITKDKAYVCFCNPERLRKLRAEGKECECRKKDYEANIKDWKWMFSSEAKEGSATLRIKTDMRHPNPAFRDRVLFRISDREHPRIKGLKVWPMLEFSAAIDDHLLGITHIIRGNQLRIEGEMEKYIWDVFGWKHPELIYTPLITLEGIKISKSKSQEEVSKGVYKGWDDPRTWSIRSLIKRGIKPEAIRNFIKLFGMSDKENMIIPIELLYNENMKLIEDSSNRYFFVNNPIKIKILKAKKMIAKIPLHPNHPERGFREIKTGTSFFISKDDFDSLEENKIYRLMHLFNFEKKKDKLVFHSTEQKAENIERMIHWLPCLKTLPKVKVLMPDGSWIEGIAEKDVKKIRQGEVIQFERFAFCRLVEKPKKGDLEFWWTHT
ncbi:MAG: glutamate--tRNA ligase [Candidatus Pacearchaeota archaeon]